MSARAAADRARAQTKAVAGSISAEARAATRSAKAAGRPLTAGARRAADKPRGPKPESRGLDRHGARLSARLRAALRRQSGRRASCARNAPRQDRAASLQLTRLTSRPLDQCLPASAKTPSPDFRITRRGRKLPLGIAARHAGKAQLGERQTEDLKVPGSIPGLGKACRRALFFLGVASGFVVLFCFCLPQFCCFVYAFLRFCLGR